MPEALGSQVAGRRSQVSLPLRTYSARMEYPPPAASVGLSAVEPVLLALGQRLGRPRRSLVNRSPDGQPAERLTSVQRRVTGVSKATRVSFSGLRT